MPAEIFDKSSGGMVSVAMDQIALNGPSIVKVNMSRSDISNLVRQGDDLLVRMKSGETLRITDFYAGVTQANYLEASSELVLEEADGSLWVARPGQGALVL